jgi:hypothetical protein
MFWTINSGPSLLSFYWIPDRRFEGSLMEHLRMHRKRFDHVPDIAEQSETAFWIEKSASFNMICIKSNMFEPVAAKSRPEIIP